MVNKRSLLQRFLFANSSKSTIRHRSKPRIYDEGFLPMLRLSRGLKKFIERTQPSSVLDIGGGDMPYKHYFSSGVKFVGIDYYSNLQGVKKIDIEKPFFEEKADFVICSEVLEHSYEYKVVIENIYNNLKDGGSAYVTVPFAYEVHGWDYHDYFRYTEETLKKLFSQFTVCEVRASTTYVATLMQKWNNLVFYIPLPYILKIPFFFVNNILILLVEGVTRGILKVLGIKNDNLLHKLVFSYPINYICYLKK